MLRPPLALRLLLVFVGFVAANARPSWGAQVFDLFDDLLLLARAGAKYGGRVAYHGPACEAQPYFEDLGYVFNPRVLSLP